MSTADPRTAAQAAAQAAAATLGLPDIEAAALRLQGQVPETPCLASRTLSAIVGCEVYLKFENLQFTASFKERGALNKLMQLSPAERERGVLAVSAGNHAQGVAYHAQRLGIPATVVMPVFAPLVKVDNTRRFGASVVLHGHSFDDARQHGLHLAQERNLTLVHPFDDLAVIAGQGTLGLEMLRQQPDLDVLVVPVGGGGLLAGIAVAARALKPGIELIGVQAERFPGAWAGWHGRDPASAEGLRRGQSPVTMADGIGVHAPGALTLPLLREYLDDMLLVSEDAIEQAVLMLLEIEKTVVEGAGAVGLAALCTHPARFAGRKVGLVLCGGNIEPLVLAEIIHRGMVKSGRLARLRFDVRDVPGSLARLAQLLGESGANIEEVQHQRAFSPLPMERTQIDVVVRTRGPAHVEEILAACRSQGLDAAHIDVQKQ
jgi:threonine dehydratase